MLRGCTDNQNLQQNSVPKSYNNKIVILTLKALKDCHSCRKRTVASSKAISIFQKEVVILLKQLVLSFSIVRGVLGFWGFGV
jgi:hypothetical protein